MDYETLALMKKHKKAVRAANLAAAYDRSTDVARACVVRGLELIVQNEVHWTIRKGNRTLIQYWPSSQRMQVCRTSKRGSRVDITIDRLLDFLERGTY